MRHLTVALAVVLCGTASAQFGDWQHSGSLYVLTTPEGAGLPASASEDGFPLLVRLHRDFFDFAEAQPGGGDVRFSTGLGTVLPHQIEQWNAEDGAAAIWVRLPVIKGDSRQEIRMHWGNPEAKAASDGKAVFNESNGYVSVFHMGEPVVDEAGTVVASDTGTTPVAGMIGYARHLAGGKGVFCGDKIEGLPEGAAPHSTEAWFRSETVNSTVVAWGNEQAQGKVVVQFVSPPRVRTDCYFSNGNVRGDAKLTLSEWVHVMHTYTSGDARLYVNGVLDGVNAHGTPPLSIKTPARMWIGGWYNRYSFVGDVDELRISSVVRSADWVRLQHENQKSMHTVVGPLVARGNALAVTPAHIAVREGGHAALRAQAGGAQKLYWILKTAEQEKVVAVDRLSFTFDAGRVSGNQALTLQLSAVYPDGVRTQDIPVRIEESVPEPVVTLAAPKQWDGRKTIELAPVIVNLDELRAEGVDDLAYSWDASGIAVIKESVPGKLVLLRSQSSGMLTVRVTVSNGGVAASAESTINVAEPAVDEWIRRVPDKDEMPEDNQFYARDDTGVGTLYCNGTLAEDADSVFLRLYRGDELCENVTRDLPAHRAYELSAKLEPGLVKYRVEFGSRIGERETVLHRAVNIVCGDAYIIEGQSNALATDTREESPREQHEWIRSYGMPLSAGSSDPSLWCKPVWKFERGAAHRESREKHKAELGWWGMELAKRLVKSQEVPICIINGAVGGTRIDQHQRSPGDPEDLGTIYGRLLWRVRRARLTHGVRAVIWHQGESDQGAQGPDGDYGWKTYQQYFVDMSAAWKQDFPNIRHYYVFQIWPNSCSMGNGHGNMLREVQRTLPRLYSNMDVMSTIGIRPPGPCHFPLVGWSEFARLLQPLIKRDFYGGSAAGPITAPNLRRAAYTTDVKNAIALEFDQPVVWADPLVDQFYLDGAKGEIASGSVSGNVLTLQLKESSSARTITYLDERSWSQDKLLIGTNSIAALTFCNVPIEQ